MPGAFSDLHQPSPTKKKKKKKIREEKLPERNQFNFNAKIPESL